MITLIYFITISSVLIIGPISIVWFLSGKAQLNSKLVYLIVASTLPVSFITVSKQMVSLRWVNFLQHTIGGGIAVGLACIYIIYGIREKYPIFKNLFVQIVFVFMVVSALGNLNELLEFYFDSTGVGIFSADRYDTWYDILANTFGALSIYSIHKVFELIIYKFIGRNK